MIVSGVIVSGAQQSNSVIHIHIPILPQTPLLFKLSYNIEELYISFSFWASALAKQTLASILLTYGVFSLHGWKEKSHHLNISCFPVGSGGKESACNAGDWVRSLGWEDPLEEGMATHSSILAWRIPWTEEPGGLQSVQLWRVGHDWATNTFTFTTNLVLD